MSAKQRYTALRSGMACSCMLCYSRACTWAALHEVASKKDELRLIQHTTCPKHVHGFLRMDQVAKVRWVSPESTLLYIQMTWGDEML